MEVEEGTENRGHPPSGGRAALNLPAGMSLDSLRLETRMSRLGPGSPMKQPLGNSSLPAPSPTRTSYSDRFIPSRTSSNLTNYALLDRSPSGANSTHANDNREDGAAAYSQLLRTELFGPEAGSLSPATPEKALSLTTRDPTRSPMSPTRNLFRFKTDHRAGGLNSRPESPYSLSPVGVDGALTGVVTSPRKAPRKIARSPYKVCFFFLVLIEGESNVLNSDSLLLCSPSIVDCLVCTIPSAYHAWRNSCIC